MRMGNLTKYTQKLAGLPVSPVNIQVAETANHKGPEPRCQNLYPQGLGTSTLHIQFGYRADVVGWDFHI